VRATGRDSGLATRFGNRTCFRLRAPMKVAQVLLMTGILGLLAPSAGAQLVNRCPKILHPIGRGFLAEGIPAPSIEVQCRDGYCDEGAHAILGALVALGVDLSLTEVYYISDFDFFDYHVVVRYRDQIYDPGRVQGGKLAPQYVDDFFRGFVDPDQRIRPIDGPTFFAELPVKGTSYFNEPFSKNPALRLRRRAGYVHEIELRFPSIPLVEFLGLTGPPWEYKGG
jgi:hypothetical protein